MLPQMPRRGRQHRRLRDARGRRRLRDAPHLRAREIIIRRRMEHDLRDHARRPTAPSAATRSPARPALRRTCPAHRDKGRIPVPLERIQPRRRHAVAAAIVGAQDIARALDADPGDPAGVLMRRSPVQRRSRHPSRRCAPARVPDAAPCPARGLRVWRRDHRAASAVPRPARSASVCDPIGSLTRTSNGKPPSAPHRLEVLRAHAQHHCRRRSGWRRQANRRSPTARRRRPPAACKKFIGGLPTKPPTNMLRGLTIQLRPALSICSMRPP